jgi:hypothetical protein
MKESPARYINCAPVPTHAQPIDINKPIRGAFVVDSESIPDSAPTPPGLIYPPTDAFAFERTSSRSIKSQSNQSLSDLGIVGNIRFDSFEKSDQSNDTSDDCMYPAAGAFVSKDLRKSEYVNKLYESLQKPPELSHIEKQNYEHTDTLIELGEFIDENDANEFDDFIDGLEKN